MRKISLDLLRIIAMAAVVAFHYQIHIANDMAMYNPFSAKTILLVLLGSWGVYGSNVFFCISSYFLQKKDDINVNHVISILIKTMIFGIVLYIIAYFMGGVDRVTTKDIVNCILAPFTYQYWFVTIWFLLMLISPLLNIILNHMNRRNGFIVLSILFVYLFVYSSIKGFEINGRLGCAIWIYLTIGYINKFNLDIIQQNCGKLLLGCCAINIIYELVVEYFNILDKRFVFIFENGASATAAIGGISMFLLFLGLDDSRWNSNLNKFLMLLGKHSFGIFLICFPGVVSRHFIYDGILRGDYYYNKSVYVFMLAYILTVILVCIGGIISDYIYEKTLGIVIKIFTEKLNITV